MTEHIYPVEHELVDRLGEWVRDRDDLSVQWRLQAEQDDTSVMDHVNGCDAYGVLVWTRNNVDTGWSVRPDGPNNHHARVAERGHGSTLWWMPNPEVWGDESYSQDDAARDFAFIRDLMRDGIAAALLTRRTICPCCEQAIDRHAALGGIDVWPYGDDDAKGYWRDVASDLMAEVGD